MEKLPPIFKLLLTRLDEQGVEYLLVGGHAVRYYGFRRETNDLDLWIADDDPVNAAKIVAVLQEICGAVAPSTLAALSRPFRIVEMILPPPRIDIKEPIIGAGTEILESFTGQQTLRVEFLTIQSGVNFHAAYAARVRGDLDGAPVTIASLEDIKTIKRSGGRPKDLADLDQLPGMPPADGQVGGVLPHK